MPRRKKVEEEIVEKEPIVKATKTRKTKTDSAKSSIKKEDAQSDKPKTSNSRKTKAVSTKDKEVEKKTSKVEEKTEKVTKKTTAKAEKKATTKKTADKEEASKKNTSTKKATAKKADTKTKPKETKKAAQKATTKRRYGKYEDELYDEEEDDDVMQNPFLIEEEEEEEDPDAFTEEDLKNSSDFDEEEYEKEQAEAEAQKLGKQKYKKVFSTSSHSEEVRQKFFDICKRYNSGDPELKKQANADAVEELQNFVHFVIKKKYATYTKYYEDLVQEGVLGILKGMEKYDPSKSLPTTYFNLYIIHEISKYIDTEVNKTTSHYSSNLTKINRVIERFEQSGRKWDVNSIVVETNLNMETVQQCLNIRECKNEVYLDADDSPEFNIKDEKRMTPEQEVIEKERNEVLNNAIATLLPEEQEVLKYRFGLDNTKVISFKEIAKKMGISIERVRKYKNDAIRKLKYKSVVRNTFKEYINPDMEKMMQTHEVPLIPEEIAKQDMDYIEQIDFDFDSMWNNED